MNIYKCIGSNANQYFSIDSKYYQEELSVILQTQLHQSKERFNGKPFNWDAFFGNHMLDYLLQHYFKKNISICDIGSFSGMGDYDCYIECTDGSRYIIELKIRHDDDYVKFPKTCKGEKDKYNKLKAWAIAKHAIPIIMWIQNNGEVSMFDLRSYTPNWYVGKDQYENHSGGKDKKVEKEFGLYYKRFAFKNFIIKDYNSILNFFLRYKQK